MLAIDWEPIPRLVADGAEDLIHKHWLETSINRDEVPLAPDWRRVFLLEKQGVFKGIGLRRNGALIGYAVFAVEQHIHFRSTCYATCNVLYVLPKFRGYAGGRLLRRSEELLADLGVRKIIHSVPLASNEKLGALLQRLGYSHTEAFYCKLVG